MTLINKLWLGIGILIILSPLGIILPEHFKAGSAWGEWGTDEIRQLVGYVPKGLAKLSSLWNAPISGYTFGVCQEKGLLFLSFSYILSAILGILICIGLTLLLGKFLSKKRNL